MSRLLSLCRHLDLGYALVEVEFLRGRRRRTDPCLATLGLLLGGGRFLVAIEGYYLEAEVLFAQPPVMIIAKLLDQRHQFVRVLLDVLLLSVDLIDLTSDSSFAAQHFILAQSHSLKRFTSRVLPLTEHSLVLVEQLFCVTVLGNKLLANLLQGLINAALQFRKLVRCSLQCLPLLHFVDFEFTQILSQVSLEFRLVTQFTHKGLLVSGLHRLHHSQSALVAPLEHGFVRHVRLALDSPHRSLRQVINLLLEIAQIRSCQLASFWFALSSFLRAV